MPIGPRPLEKQIPSGRFPAIEITGHNNRVCARQFIAFPQKQGRALKTRAPPEMIEMRIEVREVTTALYLREPDPSNDAPT